MKTAFFAVALMVIAGVSSAQIEATTASGELVLLHDNGTWSYKDSADAVEEKEIAVNDKPFFKPSNASFLVKSNKVAVGVWIDPKKWSFSKNSSNEAAEFQFSLKGDDLYAMLIAERLVIPLEALKRIALDNARAAAPDIKVVKEEFRTVNGAKVLMMQMAGTIQGMRICYNGYYFSSSAGTIQLLTYTGENLMAGFQRESDSLLNGLVSLEAAE